MMLPPTRQRVRASTAAQVNQRIRKQTERNVMRAVMGGPAAMDRRLRDLDSEWDVERCLETMAPTFSLLGLTLGVAKDRKWLLVPAVVQTFLLQHALQGWCPPVPALRRLGFRTMHEIDEEHYALKALRGDFRRIAPQQNVSADSRVIEALEAIRS